MSRLIFVLKRSKASTLRNYYVILILIMINIYTKFIMLC